jgi:hypothetical protein
MIGTWNVQFQNLCLSPILQVSCLFSDHVICLISQLPFSLFLCGLLIMTEQMNLAYKICYLLCGDCSDHWSFNHTMDIHMHCKDDGNESTMLWCEHRVGWCPVHEGEEIQSTVHGVTAVNRDCTSLLTRQVTSRNHFTSLTLFYHNYQIDVYRPDLTS